MATIRIDKGRLPKLPGQVKRNVNRVIREAGFDVLSDGQSRIRAQGLIDTGQLLSSGYVKDEGDAVRVGFSARHGIFHELGTRRNPSRPFLVPAYNKVRAELPKRLKGVI